MTISPTITIEDIEQILSELELLARGDSASEEFYGHLLNRFVGLVQASQAALIVVLPRQKPFLKYATQGCLVEGMAEVAGRLMSEKIADPFLIQATESQSFMAIRRQAEQESTEVLVASFDGDLDATTHPALRELGFAFCELLHARSMHRLERFLANDWTRWCKVSEAITDTESISLAAQVLADGVREILDADRVSIATSRNRISAISGVTNFSSSSRLVSLITSVTATCLRSQTIETSPQRSAIGVDTGSEGSSPGLFENWLAIPVLQPNGLQTDCVLLLEWSDRRRMLDSSPVLSMLMASIANTWNRQRRWLIVPAFARRCFTNGSRWTLGNTMPWLIKWSVLATLAACLVVLAFLPSPVFVEAPANVEPEELRPIHAPADGIIQTVYVRDADSIKKGDKILELYSPNLEIQIEQTRGEIAETFEKRNGLNAALSQLASNQKDDESNRLRISTEIALNQTQERLLKEKLAFLLQERARLNVVSPIEGQVISRNLQRELTGRPVVHGEELLSIANLESRWLLQARVADQDSLLLRNQLENGPAAVRVTFDNLPDRSFRGSIVQVGIAMEAEFGVGAYLPIVVAMDEEAAQHASIGAGATVALQCGDQPTWYVWTRPLVDFVRRKFWLYFPGTDR